MTNNNAFMIKVNCAILHHQQINGAIYIITLKVVLLKMDLIATIYIKGIALLMWNLTVIMINHFLKMEFIVGPTMV